MHSDKRFVTGMLEAGASGYLLKDCAFNELAGAIRRVNSNHLYISPGIPDAVAGSINNVKSCKPATLTKREGEILRLLADGRTTRQIAAVLKISSSTIQTHVRNIMLKLDLSSTAELIKYALKEGIISLEK
jgi:DNA-binding NarL/FixJ family response regulator